MDTKIIIGCLFGMAVICLLYNNNKLNKVMATIEQIREQIAQQNEAIANIAADIQRLAEGAGIPDEVLAEITAQTDKLKSLAAQTPEPPDEAVTT